MKKYQTKLLNPDLNQWDKQDAEYSLKHAKSELSKLEKMDSKKHFCDAIIKTLKTRFRKINIDNNDNSTNYPSNSVTNFKIVSYLLDPRNEKALFEGLSSLYDEIRNETKEDDSINDNRDKLLTNEEMADHSTLLIQSNESNMAFIDQFTQYFDKLVKLVDFQSYKIDYQNCNCNYCCQPRCHYCYYFCFQN